MAAIDTLALISYGLSSNGSFLPNLRERERGGRGEGEKRKRSKGESDHYRKE